jgi:hypothetical protein
MREKQFALNGDIMGAGGFAVAPAGAAEVGFCTRDSGILKHGLFFTALGYEVVMVSHYCVDWHSVRALGFAFSAGVTAVEFTACFSIGIQFCLIGFGYFLSRETKKAI